MNKGTKLFKNTTLSEKNVLYMKIEKEFPEVESATRKYRVFHGTKLYYFVGRSGSVRINYKNAATGSRSQTTIFKRIVKDWENIQNPESVVEV